MTRDDGTERDELILDPTTYRFLGYRTVATRDRTMPKRSAPGTSRPPSDRSPEVQRAGQVLINVGYLPGKVVDKPGQR
ncbi:hypothetical protein ACGFNU_33355 [Spirillospora sp. NPDC048911]|uniref:hypothetical protein n=1 Tax=Spirillospora sp. NPDC048911 TaxID=3364527 RepID=UPI003722EEA4